MAMCFPGTTVEISQFQKNSSVQLFDGLFAAGGITLSQVSAMTELEPYLIQNWVKRGFVSSPVRRMYSRDQLARILIINMLRDSLQIEKISNLIGVISGNPKDVTDDLISDSELYHRYVNMLAEGNLQSNDADGFQEMAMKASEDFEEPMAGARKKLIAILQVMFYAHTASQLRKKAEDLLSGVT